MPLRSFADDADVGALIRCPKVVTGGAPPGDASRLSHHATLPPGGSALTRPQTEIPACRGSMHALASARAISTALPMHLEFLWHRNLWVFCGHDSAAD